MKLFQNMSVCEKKQIFFNYEKFIVPNFQICIFNTRSLRKHAIVIQKHDMIMKLNMIFPMIVNSSKI